VQLNCFSCALATREDAYKIGEHERNRGYLGLWEAASYINHSCIPNAGASFIGDVMVVRAMQDLPPGTEITLAYSTPMTSYATRQKRLAIWEFMCSCPLCKMETTMSETVFAERNTIWEGLLRRFPPGKSVDMMQADKMLDALTNTYRVPATIIPRFRLCDSLLHVMLIHWTFDEKSKMVDAALRTLESIGFVLTGGGAPRGDDQSLVVERWGLVVADPVLPAWLVLARAYRDVAPDLERQALEYARISYRIAIGEDETFEYSCKNVSQMRVFR
jgi:hypothetical protein